MMYVIAWGEPDVPSVTIEVHVSRAAAVAYHATDPAWKRAVAMHGGLLLDLPLDATDEQIREETFSRLIDLATVVRVIP